jgi:hypothetical protein
VSLRERPVIQLSPSSPSRLLVTLCGDFNSRIGYSCSVLLLPPSSHARLSAWPKNLER